MSMHVGERELVDEVDSIATFTSDKYNIIPINGTKGLLRLICLEPYQSVQLHRHQKADEYFFVVRGRSKVTVGSEESDVEPGCIIRATKDTPHGWKNKSERSVLLSVLIPFLSYKFADEAGKMELI